ncbi:SDR family oxidoreductase [Mesorhizobium sp. M3A.F.Ca.ET.201.01.1.1]|uniref:SDR family NAD(P)-dependent oxidoreductase n=1 Tax=Mesorhizobium sp. M3A.F.Ca.ET.201.01.1.1 TaxID=2563946 RepID=UPI001093CAD1|nr:SDR family oxidoreductase [Mesorhizobium sp. M3A.F.Ca.ET.201.01.1.1]TGS71745.1 SDR family oxidoreductase [Mesorhizobium sp. M3A.F.Ca.ET.201.01.1.1]
MTWGLDGKLALVTGGAGGIGEEICFALAESGARVVLHDLQNAPRASVCERINAAGFAHEVTTTFGDLADLDALQKDVVSLVAEIGPVSVLVNNAAINPRGPIETYALEDFVRVQAINAHAAFVLSQAVMPGMRKAGGAIVNIGSQTLAGGVPDMVPYVSAKGALLGLTRSLAREAGPYGVRVNMVSPGAIPTDLERRVWADQLARVEAEVVAKQSLKFRGSARDVANAVLFLASEKSRFITGHELNVNGGWHMG